MSMDMVERVARALDEAAFMPGAHGAGFAVRRSVAKDRARAAIRELREPTRPMFQAMYDAQDTCMDSDKYVDSWYAGIDAALAEAGEGR